MDCAAVKYEACGWSAVAYMDCVAVRMRVTRHAGGMLLPFAAFELGVFSLGKALCNC